MKITISQLRSMVEEAILDEKKKKRKKKKKKKKGGKKDACYHKVKARYDVWPSAYASGALVKCRKVGAKNWGNSKKESISRDRIKELVEAEIAKIERRKRRKENSPPNHLQRPALGIGLRERVKKVVRVAG